MNTPVKLLYLEDDEIDRRAFLRMVREKNLPYDLTTAETLAEARAHLARSRFDVIAADYHLPDGHSTELFDEVRDTPFVLLTGTLEEQLALRTLEGGADDYLPKGPDQRHLEAVPFVVEKTLHRKHLRETEQRLTRILRQSEERFRLLVEGVKDYAIYMLEPEGRVTTWNAGAQHITQYTAEEIIGRHFSSFYSPGDVAAGKPERALAIAAEQGHFADEGWRVRKDGSSFWADVAITALRNPAGELVGFANVTHDMTERQQAEAALAKSSARLEGIISSAMDSIISIDAQQRVVLFNAAAEKMFGVSAAEALGQGISRFIPERFRAAHARHVENFGKTGVSTRTMGALGTLSGLRANGQEFPIEASISQIEVQGEKLFTVILRDITQRKRAELELQKLAAVVHNSGDFIGICTSDMEPLFLNEAGRRMVGLESTEEMLRTPIMDYFWPEDRPSIESQAIPTLLREGRWSGEVRFRHFKTGEPIYTFWDVFIIRDAEGRPVAWATNSPNLSRIKHAELALRQSEERFRTMANSIPQLAWIARPDGYIFWFNQRWYDYTGTTPQQVEGWGWQSVHDPLVLPQVLDLWRASLAAGAPAEMEVPLRGADGHFRPFLARVVPLKDSAGRVTFWFGTNTDITDIVAARETLARSRVELERLVQQRTAQLHEANANLQTFAYSAAHDLRSPLRSIKGFSDIALAKYGPHLDSMGRSMLERISCSADQMDRLLTDLLEYSKMSQAELKLGNVSLQNTVRDALALLEADIRAKNAAVTVEDSLPEIIGHPATVVLLINNFVSNALKFVAPGMQPQIRIRAELVQSPESTLARSEIKNQKSKINKLLVRLSVQDNGIGIAPKDLGKVFEVFQRLHGKDAYPGTGLGLAIARKAAERMGGCVGVESQPGKGSKFWVDLPRPSTKSPPPLLSAAKSRHVGKPSTAS